MYVTIDDIVVTACGLAIWVAPSIVANVSLTSLLFTMQQWRFASLRIAHTNVMMSLFYNIWGGRFTPAPPTPTKWNPDCGGSLSTIYCKVVTFTNKYFLSKTWREALAQRSLHHSLLKESSYWCMRFCKFDHFSLHTPVLRVHKVRSHFTHSQMVFPMKKTVLTLYMYITILIGASWSKG